ncbi:hypothetical protein Q73_03405 [Bacillus coahuilensis m2-6]|uniref:YheC/YheD family endospore coat-associated protein n=1 Tax=Bacillus coahuilensis TaxID=408580 RepID=UPI00075060E2|nr:YheC/YheD family protein [Bacillus coahuilensis]KUP09335.1 hypothetical protein Q73_03405 [Bacillus coahuilensis m2-6]
MGTRYEKINYELVVNTSGIEELILPLDLIRSLRIPVDKPIQLEVGLCKVPCIIQSDSISTSPMITWKSTILPAHKGSLYFAYNLETSILSVGPIIAILTAVSKGQEPIGHLTSYFLELRHLLTEQGGVIYCTNFSELHENQISGIFFEEAQGFFSTMMPIPTIIYNRIHSRKKEQKPSFHNFIQWCKENHVYVFNEAFLNKWHVHTILTENKDLNSHIPFSILYDSHLRLEQFLLEHEDIFIKPVHGSQGRNIVRIQKEHGEYNVKSSSNEHALSRYTSLPRLIDYIKTLNLFDQAIIQQTIPLASNHNRLMDFRFLLIPNKDLQWEVVSAVVRFSKENHFITNLSQGGLIKPAQRFLKEYYGHSYGSEVYDEMKQISKITAVVLSEALSTNLGELGIDLALDVHRNIWIIEVNSKPSKNMSQSKPFALLLEPLRIIFIPFGMKGAD